MTKKRAFLSAVYSTVFVASFLITVATYSTAHAASLQITGGVRAAANSGEPAVTDQASGNIVNTLPSGPTSISESLVAVASGPGQASATAEVDAVTGQLKARIDTNNGILDTSNGSLTLWMSETFSVSGSGMLTASLQVDGTYDVSAGALGLSEGYQVQAQLFQGAFLGSGTSHTPFGLNPLIVNQNNSPTSGTIDHLISGSTFISAGTTSFTLIANLLAQISNGEGFIDLSNTASFIFETTGTLSLEPMDPLFLSDPGFGSTVVPLPAALPLFGTGLGLLGLLGWWRRRQPAAA